MNKEEIKFEDILTFDGGGAFNVDIDFEASQKKLLKALTQHEESVIDSCFDKVRKKLCSRTGIHTCRVGAVHMTNEEKKRILEALTNN